MESAKTQVRKAEDDLRAAMIASDVETLERLLHDDLVFSGPDGTVIGKTDDLRAHAARRLQLTELRFDELEIACDESRAEVQVRATLTGTFDGAVCDGRYQYRRTWCKGASGWQVIAGSVRAEPEQSTAPT